MSGIRTSISSALRYVAKLGRSSKRTAPTEKRSKPSHAGAETLAPRGEANLSSVAPMAPRGKTPVAPSWLKSRHPAHPLPPPPQPTSFPVPTPQSLGVRSRREESKSTLPTPEALGLRPRREEPKPTLPTPESLGIRPKPKPQPAQQTLPRPGRPTLADLLKLPNEVAEAPMAAERRTLADLLNLPDEVSEAPPDVGTQQPDAVRPVRSLMQTVVCQNAIDLAMKNKGQVIELHLRHPRNPVVLDELNPAQTAPDKVVQIRYIGSGSLEVIEPSSDRDIKKKIGGKALRRPGTWVSGSSTKALVNALQKRFAEYEISAGVALAKTATINRLKSAPKINLANTPDLTIDYLPSDQLKLLVRALGGGELSETRPDVRELQVELARLRLSNFQFDRFSDNIDWKLDLQSKVVWHELPPYKQKRLEEAAKIAHMSIGQWVVTDPQTGQRKTRMDVYFGGTLNWRDAKQDVRTAFGGVGEVYKATREAAELVAEVLAANPRLDMNRVMGFSMGGGTAQAFLAGVESRVEMKEQPVLVLFDPQLLNDAQARHAVKDTPFDYDYSKLRGVAITLDYEADSRMGLMNVMKGPGGYKSPGLVQLRLGLKDGDDVKVIKRKVSFPPATGDTDQALAGSLPATPAPSGDTAEASAGSVPAIPEPSGDAAQAQAGSLSAIPPTIENVVEEVLEKLPATPKTSGPPFLGYHSNSPLYKVALDRFVKPVPPDFEKLLLDDLDEYQEGPRDDEVRRDDQLSRTRSDGAGTSNQHLSARNEVV